MTSSNYIFDDAAAVPELQRLQLLESVFDAKTCDWILSTGSLAGRRCLEVGAGAGSIAIWMATQVGNAGRVTAIDNNTRFLQGLDPRIEIIEGELGKTSMPAESFDLVHARYVLIHNEDAARVVEAMSRGLRPGGVLVLEEPDFGVATAMTGSVRLRQGFENVQRALRATFTNRGMDFEYGRKLPGYLHAAGLAVSAVEYDCPVQEGGSALAEMMRLSTESLRDTYIATGRATLSDIADYAEFARAAECWGLYYATVRVVARK